jgi:uncharacterized protein YecE (DUF72 family)
MPPSGITSGMTATETSLARLHVGASGFSYPSWRGGFYPAGAKPGELLGLYAERLSSVELNGTFYRLPSEAQFASWAAATPPEFRFAVKMPRQITHFGRADLIGTFCERVRLLGDRLGPVRILFPDERPRDDGLLRLYLDSLDPELSYAFDLRHPTWQAEEVDEALAGAGAAHVGALEGTVPFRYLRLRETPYDDRSLAAWADRLRPFLAGGVDVFVYFKHEDQPTAPLYAEELRKLVAARARS